MTSKNQQGTASYSVTVWVRDERIDAETTYGTRTAATRAARLAARVAAAAAPSLEASACIEGTDRDGLTYDCTIRFDAAARRFDITEF